MKVFTDYSGRHNNTIMDKNEVYATFRGKHVYVEPIYEYKMFWHLCRILMVVDAEDTEAASSLLLEKQQAVMLIDNTTDKPLYTSVHRPF